MASLPVPSPMQCGRGQLIPTYQCVFLVSCLFTLLPFFPTFTHAAWMRAATWTPQISVSILSTACSRWHRRWRATSARWRRRSGCSEWRARRDVWLACGACSCCGALLAVAVAGN